MTDAEATIYPRGGPLVCPLARQEFVAKQPLVGIEAPYPVSAWLQHRCSDLPDTEGSACCGGALARGKPAAKLGMGWVMVRCGGTFAYILAWGWGAPGKICGGEADAWTGYLGTGNVYAASLCVPWYMCVFFHCNAESAVQRGSRCHG
jgi:hypothetical protein